jgi:SagB-type dehydrogenase family enzyme
MSQKDVIKLPAIDYDDDFPLVKAILKRRSVRQFTREALSDGEMGVLLWACSGVTDTARGFRTAPSAGAIYPIRSYIVIEKGVYRYEPSEHVLTLHKAGDLRKEISAVALAQKAVVEAGAILVFSYCPEDLEARYDDRAFRYACMEVGHMAQNSLLAAEALGLSAVAIGAYHDDWLKKVLELEEDVLYLIAVGKER